MTADNNRNQSNAEIPLTASFALNGPGFIEASAGTGKTFTITCLITRLLLGSNKYNPLPLDKMLVMTFTRSAARDLKRKIRERLMEVLSIFQDYDDAGASVQERNKDKKKLISYPDNRYLWDFVRMFHDPELPDEQIEPDVLKRRNSTARIILRNALTNIDKASISTIHSFCSGMLKRHAISARIPFAQNLLTDDKASQKCAEAVMETVREFFYDSALSREENEKLLEETGLFSDDKWLDTLTGLLEGSYGPSHTIHRYSSADGKLEKAGNLSEVLKILPEIAEELNSSIKKRVQEQNVPILRLLQEENTFLNEYADRLHKSYPEFFDIKFNKIGSGNNKLPGKGGYSPEKCTAFFRECQEDTIKEYKKKSKENGDGKLCLFNFIKSKIAKSDVKGKAFFENNSKNDFASLLGDIESVLLKNTVLIDEKDVLCDDKTVLQNIVYDRILTRASEILEKKKDVEGFLFQDDLLSRLKTALAKQASGEEAGNTGVNAVRDLRDAILKDYPVAIIDEFQDTDPIQFFIVSQVYLNYFKEQKQVLKSVWDTASDKDKKEIQGFYVIGDPKQSIYLFRGADVSCYNGAVKTIEEFWKGFPDEKAHQGTLDINFRSNPLLVYQVNSLFSDIYRLCEGNAGEAFSENGSDAKNSAGDEKKKPLPKIGHTNAHYYMSYRRGDSWKFAPVRAKNEKAGKEEDEQDFLILRNADENSVDGSGVIPWPLTIMYDTFPETDGVSPAGVYKKFSESCAREIVRVLNQGWITAITPPNTSGAKDKQEKKDTPVSLSDIAVLVSSSKEARYISGALARYGVPSVFTSNRMKITDTLEFESVYDLMQAFLNPKDNRILRYLVSGSFFNWTAQDISDNLADGFEDISPVLVAGAEKWKEGDFMSAYCYFTRELKIFEKLSKVTGGEAIITNLNQAAEIAQGLTTRVSAREGMVSLYRKLMDEPDNDEAAEELSDYSVRAGASDRVIRITTYHSSKGLEYNIVFMPFAGIWKNNSNKANNSFSPFSYLEDEDKVPEGEGRLRYDITGDPELKNQHAWNEMGETLRVWYVAATRAKYAMFLWTGFMGGTEYFKQTSKGMPSLSSYYPLYVQLRKMAGQVGSQLDNVKGALRDLFCEAGANRTIMNNQESDIRIPDREITDADRKDLNEKISRNAANIWDWISKICEHNGWKVKGENTVKDMPERASFLIETESENDPFLLYSSRKRPEWDPARRKLQLGDTDGTELAVRPFGGNIPDYWRILSYSSLVGARTHHGGAVQVSPEPEAGEDEQETREPEITDMEPVSRKNEPRNLIQGGINTGLFLHSIFEHLTFEKIREDRRCFADLREQGRTSRQALLDSINTARVIADRLEVYSMSEEWRTDQGLLDLTEWILSASETPMQDTFGNTFALRDLRDFHTVKEMDFYMHVASIEDIARLSDIVRNPKTEDYPGKLSFKDSDPEHDKGGKNDGKNGGKDSEKQTIISSMKVMGFLTGSLDLFFEYGGRYYVADYKSNKVPGNMDKPGFCDRNTMRQIITDSRYDFQYVIYTVAMHRFLRQKLGSAYSYEKHIGGIFYLFLRGMMGERPEHTGRPDSQGVYYVRLPESLVEAADRFFENESLKGTAGNGN